MPNDNDPITVDAAADIAREHGLGLPDAQALAGLARTVGEARTLAARFAKPDGPARSVVRQLFTPPKPDRRFTIPTDTKD